MRAIVPALSIAVLLVVGTGPMHAAVKYPFVVTLDAQLTTGVTSVTSKITVRVERAMTDGFRTQVTDALMHGGYSNFVGKLRPMPAVGTVSIPSATLDLRYTREEPSGGGTRLVLIADHPLFFLKSEQAQSRVGYELTVMELQLDGQGGVTGQMSGAARVKPSPDGVVLLDTYVDNLVQLKGRVGQ